jgi:hypothetical protein
MWNAHTRFFSLALLSRHNGEYKSEGWGETKRVPLPSLNGVLGEDMEWTVKEEPEGLFYLLFFFLLASWRLAVFQ